MSESAKTAVAFARVRRWSSRSRRHASNEVATSAAASRERYQAALDERGLGAITTEVQSAGAFYWAEDDHQQYLSKHPNGYCGLGGTGVSCPVGLGVDDA